jgi:hypothetical protein
MLTGINFANNIVNNMLIREIKEDSCTTREDGSHELHMLALIELLRALDLAHGLAVLHELGDGVVILASLHAAGINVSLASTRSGKDQMHVVLGKTFVQVGDFLDIETSAVGASHRLEFFIPTREFLGVGEDNKNLMVAVRHDAFKNAF